MLHLEGREDIRNELELKIVVEGFNRFFFDANESNCFVKIPTPSRDVL